jgi:hypothetical protein
LPFFGFKRLIDRNNGGFAIIARGSPFTKIPTATFAEFGLLKCCGSARHHAQYLASKHTQLPASPTSIDVNTAAAPPPPPLPRSLAGDCCCCSATDAAASAASNGSEVELCSKPACPSLSLAVTAATVGVTKPKAQPPRPSHLRLYRSAGSSTLTGDHYHIGGAVAAIADGQSHRQAMTPINPYMWATDPTMCSASLVSLLFCCCLAIKIIKLVVAIVLRSDFDNLTMRRVCCVNFDLETNAGWRSQRGLVRNYQSGAGITATRLYQPMVLCTDNLHATMGCEYWCLSCLATVWLSEGNRAIQPRAAALGPLRA